jgi:photosystem II stability/assembly factor-like uncharacterized protein
VGVSEDSGQNWQATTGFKSWEIADFTWHPTNAQEVWAGTMSGPYVSRDGGRTWQEMRAGFPALGNNYTAPIQKILFDPTNAQHLLAFGGSHRGWPGGPGSSQWNAVWESLNGGTSWQRVGQVGNVAAPGIVAAAFAGTSKVLFAATAGQRVWKSTDDGRTWTPANQGLPPTSVTWITAHPTDANTLYVSTDSYEVGGTREPGQIFRSRDGGASWRAVTQGLHQTRSNSAALCSHYGTVALAPSNPNVLYTSDMSYWPYGIFRSPDGGDTWSIVLDHGKKQQTPTAYVPAPGMGVIAVDPKDAQHVLAGNTEYVLRTTTGGLTWQDVTSSPAAAVPGAYTGRGFSGLVSTVVRFNPFRANHAVLMGMDDGKFWQSRDGLQTWTWGGEGMPRWNGGNNVAFAGPSGDVMYASFGQFGNYGGIGKTTDGGRNWTMAPESAFPGLGGNKEGAGVYALPATPDQVWACVGGTLYRSGNGGQTWAQALVKPNLTHIEALKNAPRTFYVSGSEGVYETTDGLNFRLLPGSPANATKLRVDPGNDGRLYVMAWRAAAGGVWKRENNAWTRLSTDATICDLDVDPSNSQRLVVVTNDHPYHDAAYVSGVAVSDNGGATWTPQNEGLAMLRIETIRFNPWQAGQLVLGTYGRGFFRGQLTGGSTLTGTRADASSAGRTFALYPNPAATTVTVDLATLPVGSYQLTVTDLLGRVCHTQPVTGGQPVQLATQRLAPGSYVVQVRGAGGTYSQQLHKE